MSVAVEKLAPTAITVAAVAWCCWPHMNASTSRTGGGEGGLPEITEELLSPTIKPVCPRDPFQLTSPVETVSEGHQTPAELPDGVKETPLAESPTAGAIDVAPTAPTEPAPDALIARVLKEIALDATYIQGSRRVAVINGRIFEEGDVLTRCGSSKEPCTVQRVFRDRVRIQFRGQNTEFGYRGLTADRTNEQHDG